MLEPQDPVPASPFSSSTERGSTTPELVELDSHGDITLNVINGTDRRSFLVSSHVMRLASPVWKAMLTGGFAESRKAVISLEEDDPDALLIVLLAAHLQHRQLPKELTFDQIVKLAVICDKYDTATVVRPFLHQWISPYQSNCLEAGHEQWLSVAWAFGYTENFKDIADCLVRSSMIDSEGRCLNIEGKILEDILPADILGTLARNLFILRKMLTRYREHHEGSN